MRQQGRGRGHCSGKCQLCFEENEQQDRNSYWLIVVVDKHRDPDGLLELSPEQELAGVVWRRPSEVLADAKIFASDLRPEDISQRVVADCSLCASIVVCLLHSRSHISQVLLLLPVGRCRYLTAMFLSGCAALTLSLWARRKAPAIADGRI